MEDTAKKVYDILKEIPNLNIYEVAPDEIEDFPSVTYYISSDIPNYSVDKTLEYQSVEVTIDFWGNTSVETNELLTLVEAKMREHNYLLVSNLDILDPDGRSHKNTRFTY